MTMVECKLKDKFWCVQVVDKNSHIGLDDIPDNKKEYAVVKRGAKWIFESQFVFPGDWIIMSAYGNEVQTNDYFHKTFELVNPERIEP